MYVGGKIQASQWHGLRCYLHGGHKQSCRTNSPPVGLRAVLPRGEQQQYEQESRAADGPHLRSLFNGKIADRHSC